MGKFVITVFAEEHSHPLSTPRRVHLLRSHRSVSEAKKSLTLQFSAANVPTHQQISILEFEAGGIENIGCTKKDIYNREAKVRNELRGQDAELLKEYFLTEQENDPCFFFKIDVDDDGKLKHCFWADSVSRRAYGCFGDVVVFDTTYNTNQYGMIFAPLVGVNNHGQTDSMPTNNPKMIITDQDPAMTKAIVQSLPNTFHRYCSWHILEKFSTHLNAITYRDFYKDFQQCIWESECPEEFERKWVTTIEKASLDNNDWLKSIFELRSRWVPAYVNHIFLAGMSSSQRVESSHAFFKKYVSKRNLLMDFILRFNRALAHQRHEELGVDHVDINEKLASVIVNDGLQSLLSKIESIVSNTKSGGISEKGSTAHDYEALKDPSAVRAKGCGQRLKRGKEKATNAAKSSQNEESPQHASEYDSKADSLSSTGLHEKTKG
ncbi:protein FAR1-RELATED SEQUENCE 5-like [Ziziphus jujuba]|uniref:Protein FAR1-RELATED SEQUENCE 5-like n=1 Tax=Ziziphus jujuba TaxID=326968 RepID=A0ABM4A7S0_ZIZJJ|nr:protein FAR1-RELATED SEQUENCE 5-like [Ziziphus jujuba]